MVKLHYMHHGNIIIKSIVSYNEYMLIIMNEENIIKVQADRDLGDLKGTCISFITHLYLLTELRFLIFSQHQIMLVLNFLKAI